MIDPATALNSDLFEARVVSMESVEFAKVLRERAHEFRRMAEAIVEEHTRKSFMMLARSYDELADAEERVERERRTVDRTRM